MLDAGLGFHLATSVFVLASLSWRRKYWGNRSHLPLPPGPPPALGELQCLEVHTCSAQHDGNLLMIVHVVLRGGLCSHAEQARRGT
jgi:hypothetical protein